MSNETEIAELRGRVSVLEKLVTDTLLDKILDSTLKAINAEAVAVRAAETVQQLISEFSAPGVEQESGEGVLDIRGGGAARRAPRGPEPEGEEV